MLTSRGLIVIAVLALILSAPAYAAGGMSNPSAAGSSDKSSIQGVLNVNAASEEQLMMLPGVDNKLARNIVNYRDINGPYKSVNELKNVHGMSSAVFDRIKNNVAVKGDTTLKQGPSGSPESSPSVP